MLIFALKCDRCAFQVSPTGGGYMYVLDADGNRVICPHPLEFTTVERVTGMSWDSAPEKGLVHYAIQALCLRCAEVFDAEYEAGKPLNAQCPKCGVADARSVLDSAGTRCPQCHEGSLRRDDIGVA